jgi:hypothetical protein
MPIPADASDVSLIPEPRVYFGPSKPEFQDLKARLESRWVAEMQALLDIDTHDLPVIWDADFLFGTRTTAEEKYVLCEINVSSVFPIPDEAIEPLAEAAIREMSLARKRRG